VNHGGFIFWKLLENLIATLTPVWLSRAPVCQNVKIMENPGKMKWWNFTNREKCKKKSGHVFLRQVCEERIQTKWSQAIWFFKTSLRVKFGTSLHRQVENILPIQEVQLWIIFGTKMSVLKIVVTNKFEKIAMWLATYFVCLISINWDLKMF